VSKNKSEEKNAHLNMCIKILKAIEKYQTKPKLFYVVLKKTGRYKSFIANEDDINQNCHTKGYVCASITFDLKI
jgi:hypothetical protein